MASLATGNAGRPPPCASPLACRGTKSSRRPQGRGVGVDGGALTGRPVVVVEDCHAVDCGRDASRAGFTWTFFDVGSIRHPSTIVLRNTTTVHAWPAPRAGGAQNVRAPGALVVHQYQQPSAKPGRYAVDRLVIDDCLFDLTRGDKPLAAVRGVGSILIEDSCFLARDHGQPFFDVDDVEGRPSGKIVIENCVSPAPHGVTLRIRGWEICSLHTPGASRLAMPTAR